MSAPVPIRKGCPVRRKNRPEDADTLAHRRLLRTFDRVAFADSRDDTLEERSAALALSWAAQSKLPCNRLRFIGGTLDQRTDFELRLVEVEIADLEREAFSAKIRRTRILHGDEAARAMFDENERVFQRYRQATLDMANTAALTRRDLDRKRKAIGAVWMSAEGAWYDQLRAAVAADEERLVRGAP